MNVEFVDEVLKVMREREYSGRAHGHTFAAGFSVLLLENEAGSVGLL